MLDGRSPIYRCISADCLKASAPHPGAWAFANASECMRARRSGRSARLQPCASSCATSRLGCHMAQHEPSSARFQANRDIIPLTRESCRPNDDTDNMSWVTHSLCSHLVTFGAVCPTHGEVFNTRDMIPSMISKTCLAVWPVNAA